MRPPPSVEAGASGRFARLPVLRLATGFVLCLLTGPARAEIPIVDGDTVQFSLAGYVRALTGYQHLTYDTGGLAPDETGLGTTVVRFEWGLNLGEHVTFEVHDRFLWSLVSEQVALTTGLLGVGVSATPGRHLDLESTLVDGDGFSLTHDIDRLALRLFFDFGDLTLGRQAITWGHANLFPIADLWTSFSPFELDTSEKRGVDAARLITTPSDDLELELLVADKGDVEDLSGGVRATFYLESADVYAAVAKIWEELLLFVGVQGDLGTFSLRAELVAPYDFDDTEVLPPRAVAGFDYFGVDWLLSIELHFNGLGSENTDGYLAELASEELGRGETYLLGRYYAGALATVQLTELVDLAATTLVNLTDPSAIFAVNVSYRVAENADLVLGSYVPVGADPVLALPPTVESEFGTYGQLFYAQVSAYW